jgi:tetratricopeptide (TPR) repeat protein
MPRPNPTSLNLSLALLRQIEGWKQARLARATGISAKMLSRYETGRTSLSRELLERIIAAMGLRPEAIDWSLFYLQQARANKREASESPLGPTESERRVIERAALAKALSGTDDTRSELTLSIQNRRAQKARQEAQRLWEYLKRRPAEERRVLVEGGREYKTWALCERLCFASEEEAANDARKAIELAQLAVRVAELSLGNEAGSQRLLGFAWAFLGNAQRVQGNHPAADEAFDCYERLWNSGACARDEFLDGARLLDLKASLRRPQGRFAEALELHTLALATAKQGELGPILINKAKTLEEMGHFDEAVEAFKQAEAFVDSQRQLRLWFALRCNLTVIFTHIGRFEEAEELLPEVRQLVDRLGTGLDKVRVRWLEGKVAAGLGHRNEALAALSQVRSEFAVRRIAYDNALVTLELAVLHLELGRPKELKSLARQILPIFEAQGGHREAFAALVLFREAAEQEAATVEFTRHIIEYFHRARHSPNLRFEV